MKISTQHLESIKGLLNKANTQLAADKQAEKAAAETREATAGQVRLLNGAFDVCAAAFAQDQDLSGGQLNDLPVDAQVALGYAKNAPKAKAVEPEPEPEPAA